MYAVIDIETSSSSTYRGRITEIAIYKHDGKKVVEQFSTLVNPEGPIPREITRLTGITNEMVRDAPRFCDIARHIVEFTTDCIFVAHNASFDYGFIRHEFEMLGYSYVRPTLCTVKKSRLLMPGLTSYSLGNLCRHLSIINDARHRAAGDARATVALLEHLLAIDINLGAAKTKKEELSHYLHPKLKPEVLFEMPESTGVYYLHDQEGEVIYCGKSNNIKQRLYQHLRAPRTTKAMRLQQQAAEISYKITGSELMALLQESEDIKRLQPIFNHAQKRAIFNYGIFINSDLFGYQLLEARKIDNGQPPIAAFTSLADARDALLRVISDLQLCTGLCGIERCGNGCLNHAIGLCRGAGIYAEVAGLYNQRVEMAIASLSPLRGDFLILDKGRQRDEISAVRIAGGKLHSRGFIHSHSQENEQAILDALSPMPDNIEVRALVKGYLSQRKALRIIRLDKKREAMG